MKIETLAKKISNKQLHELITRALNGTLRTAKGISFTKKQLDGSTTKCRNIRNFLEHPNDPYPARDTESREQKIAYILSAIAQKADLSKELETMDAPNDDKASVEVATGNQQKNTEKQEDNKPIAPTESAPITHKSDAAIAPTASAPITKIDDATGYVMATEMNILTSKLDELELRYKAKLEPLQADNARLTKENQDLHQQITTLKANIAKDQALFGSILASRESELQKEIALLKSQLAAKQSDSMVIFGLRIGSTLQKFPRANNQVKEIQVWYAYDNEAKEHRKKIYLGTTFDMEKFKQVLIKKGYGDKTPQPTTPIQS